MSTQTKRKITNTEQILKWFLEIFCWLKTSTFPSKKLLLTTCLWSAPGRYNIRVMWSQLLTSNIRWKEWWKRMEIKRERKMMNEHTLQKQVYVLHPSCRSRFIKSLSTDLVWAGLFSESVMHFSVFFTNSSYSSVFAGFFLFLV